jgi:hypothetical protein
MLAKVDEVDEGGIWQGGKGGEKARLVGDLWDAMSIVVEVRIGTPRFRGHFCY